MGHGGNQWNFYLMSECFMGGGKNEMWEKCLAGIISPLSFCAAHPAPKDPNAGPPCAAFGYKYLKANLNSTSKFLLLIFLIFTH